MKLRDPIRATTVCPTLPPRDLQPGGAGDFAGQPISSQLLRERLRRPFHASASSAFSGLDFLGFSLPFLRVSASRRSNARSPWSRLLAPVLALAAVPAFAQPGQPAPVQPSLTMQDANLRPALPGALQGVGIDQKLDAQVPLNLVFRDEAGRALPLSTYFQNHKPVILALVYYRCPMLCSLILTGLESSLKAVSFDPGRDFEVVSVSFDPKDTTELAASKKQMYLRRYGRANTANGWHFLTGDQTNIRALADAVGFHYKYDPATDQFAHASGIMILTPEGRLSRYFYGVEYAPRDVRLGLVEASQNRIGNPVDQILLFCYHYDPATGKYGAVVLNLVRFAGAGFVLVCGAFLLIAFRRDLRAGRRAARRAG